MTERRILSLATALAAVFFGAAPAAASEEPPPRSAVQRGLSPTLSTGLALAAINYGQYGAGVFLGAGADTRLAGALDQRLGGGASITRFTIPGATLDLMTTEATYRIYPLALPIFVAASVGLLLSREAFDVALAQGRRIDDVRIRVGAPASLGLGVTLFRHAELQASYRQALFFQGEGPTTFGQAILSGGGRF